MAQQEVVNELAMIRRIRQSACTPARIWMFKTLLSATDGLETMWDICDRGDWMIWAIDIFTHYERADIDENLTATLRDVHELFGEELPFAEEIDEDWWSEDMVGNMLGLLIPATTILNVPTEAFDPIELRFLSALADEIRYRNSLHVLLQPNNVGLDFTEIVEED